MDGVFWVEVEMENVSGIGSRFWVFGFLGFGFLGFD